MADENEEKKIPKEKSPLIGVQAQPTTLDNTTKLDIDVDKKFVDNIVEAGLSNNLDITSIEQATTISNSRDQIYQLIDTMMKDSSVASIVRTYTEDVCEMADNGHIVWCESNDPKIAKFVNYLLNIMNVDKNIFNWVYNLIEYGDVYLRLYRESDYADPLFKKDNMDAAYSAHNRLNESLEPENLQENIYLSIHKASDPYSYYVELVPDPGTMFELTKLGKTFGYIETPNAETNMNFLDSFMVSDAAGTGTFNYKVKTNDINVYQADDFVHACLDDNYTRYPEKINLFLTEEEYKTNTNANSYSVRRGKSLLFDSYKIWREKTLLESAILLNRLTRSSVVRLIQVEVGDMPKSQVQNTIRRVKSLMEQKSALNTGVSFSEQTNPGPIENNVYLATHGGQGAVTIQSVGGDNDVKDIADLDYWTNKFYSSYGIPKQYFGWCLKFDTPILLLDGSTHTIQELFENKDKYIGKGILGCNQDGSLCPTKITNIMLTNPAAKCLRIWLDNEKYVDVTPDHRMMLRDGTFVRADELHEGDSLMPYYDKIKDGRRWVLDNKTGKFVPQYHLVSAAKGEQVEEGYNIHHKNRIKINDDFDNLVKLTLDEHCKEHNFDLATMHKKANAKRRALGKATNANVGGHYITNGIYYTTLKANEPMPDGFWFEGPKKPESMKAKISKFMSGKPKNYDTTSHLNTPEKQAKSLIGRQAYYDSISGRQDFYTRCPICGKVEKRHIKPSEYDAYLNLCKFYYCSAACRAKLDYAGFFEKSMKMFVANNKDLTAYATARNLKKATTYLKAETLSAKLNQLAEYVPEVNHKVVKIEYFDELVPVYDLTVADECHTFALPCGIFVHNCEDAAGFNGGTSLSLISSIYAKGVKRVQNSILQAITDAINLILVNKGCRSYLNNFVLKMKTPTTQEEKDYREDLANRISTVSNMQSLFADVEDKARRLEILKNLITSLNYGSDISAIIDEEIEEARKIQEEEEAAAGEESGAGSELGLGTEMGGDSGEAEEEPADLGNSSEIPMESLFDKSDAPILVEGQMMFEESDDLPLPEELHKDFTKNE